MKALRRASIAIGTFLVLSGASGPVGAGVMVIGIGGLALMAAYLDTLDDEG